MNYKYFIVERPPEDWLSEQDSWNIDSLEENGALDYWTVYAITEDDLHEAILDSNNKKWAEEMCELLNAGLKARSV